MLPPPKKYMYRNTGNTEHIFEGSTDKNISSHKKREIAQSRAVQITYNIAIQVLHCQEVRTNSRKQYYSQNKKEKDDSPVTCHISRI